MSLTRQLHGSRICNGRVQNMHKKKRIESNAKGGNKAIVFGMLERGGRVKAHVIADRKRVYYYPYFQ